MGLICDGALKTNAQVLMWDHAGSGIDGFRLYDAVKGQPFVADAKANPQLRLFAVQPTAIALSDWCFTVRAYKGDAESPSSNPVCLTPKGPAPAPVKPLVLIAPMSGVTVGGFRLLKNQNSGCPWAQEQTELRYSGPIADSFSVT